MARRRKMSGDSEPVQKDSILAEEPISNYGLGRLSSSHRIFDAKNILFISV